MGPTPELKPHTSGQNGGVTADCTNVLQRTQTVLDASSSHGSTFTSIDNILEATIRELEYICMKRHSWNSECKYKTRGTDEEITENVESNNYSKVSAVNDRKYGNYDIVKPPVPVNKSAFGRERALDNKGFCGSTIAVGADIKNDDSDCCSTNKVVTPVRVTSVREEKNEPLYAVPRTLSKPSFGESIVRFDVKQKRRSTTASTDRFVLHESKFDRAARTCDASACMRSGTVVSREHMLDTKLHPFDKMYTTYGRQRALTYDQLNEERYSGSTKLLLENTVQLALKIDEHKKHIDNVNRLLDKALSNRLLDDVEGCGKEKSSSRKNIKRKLFSCIR